MNHIIKNKGIRVSFYCTVIAEAIAMFLAIYLSWELLTVEIVFIAILITFMAVIAVGVIGAERRISSKKM